jgi:hypothetical protein
MITPRLGAPELVSAQAVPETTVNEQIRCVEQGSGRFIVKDKDLATPPGSPADGDAYIVAGSPTGAWSGWATRIAYDAGSNWASIVPIEGTVAYVQDENLEYRFDGAAWGLTPNNAPIALNDLSDVDTTGQATGDVLTWDGSEYVLAPAPGSGGGAGGTVPNGGSTGQVLRKASGVDQDVEWGGAGRVLITETVTSGSATNVQFASISGIYRDLEIRVRGRGTAAAALIGVRIRFNGDTAANYDLQEHLLQNATTSGFPAVGVTSGFIGNVAAASATANFADFLIATVGDYRGTTFQKVVHFKGSVRTAAANANLYVEHGAVWWRSTAAITQIDVFPTSGGFVDGSVVSLYGLT